MDRLDAGTLGVGRRTDVRPLADAHPVGRRQGGQRDGGHDGGVGALERLGGIGLDVMWSDNATLGFEYLFTSLTDDEYVVDVGPGTAPATNPFLIANPAGTLIRREADKFDYDTVSLTATWRY